MYLIEVTWNAKVRHGSDFGYFNERSRNEQHLTNFEVSCALLSYGNFTVPAQVQELYDSVPVNKNVQY